MASTPGETGRTVSLWLGTGDAASPADSYGTGEDAGAKRPPDHPNGSGVSSGGDPGGRPPQSPGGVVHPADTAVGGEPSADAGDGAAGGEGSGASEAPARGPCEKVCTCASHTIQAGTITPGPGPVGPVPPPCTPCDGNATVTSGGDLAALGEITGGPYAGDPFSPHTPPAGRDVGWRWSSARTRTSVA